MKKKLFLFIAAFFALSGNVTAASYTISVPNFTGYKGSEATMVINLSNEACVGGIQFKMTLPEGVTIAGFELTERATGMTISGNNGKYILFSLPDLINNVKYMIDPGSGAILNFTLNIAETVVPDDYPISFEDATISGENNENVPTTIAQATLTVKEMATVELDEESTTVPTPTTTEPVIAKVKRSIKAGQWSTICLPFAMTSEQLTEAFGDGVALAEFTDYQVEDNNYSDASGITLQFTKLAETAGTVANNPYLIKVTNDITYDEGFTVKNVTLNPNANNNEVSIEKGEGRKKPTIVFSGYLAKSTMEVGDFFISGGKFYKNTTDGKSIKGFRANFYLENMKPAFAKPMSIDIDGETTGIFEINANERTLTDGVYTINGQYVGKNVDSNTLPKGVYIINGKKKIVK